MTPVFLLCVSVAVLFHTGVVATEELDWWQKSVFYQIYPRSFKDSDGDGVGDLQGITSNLHHLKDIGVGATWLSPIYKSPMVDFGYDIADFRQIDPLFGTMDDFEALRQRATELQIHLVMDFVPNHSSDESDWFRKSLQRVDPYTDYYVWKNGTVDTETGERSPPNNWLSAFRGSAWEWREERQQYYLHQFAAKQPDLNYRNPAVVEEMKNVLRFWLDKGIDGFRVDAVPWLFERADLPDEPRSNDPNAQPGDPGYLVHVYTQNQPETYDMVQQWREVLDDYSQHDGKTRVFMLETYGTDEQVAGYYGTKERPGAHFPFNFNLIIYVNENSTAADYLQAIHRWLNQVPEGRWSNWVLGNHDQHRVASRTSPELADGLIMLTMLLPGTAVTYSGEEIGMLDNTDITWEQSRDPQACNAGPERYQQFTRDPERTPFQWDGTPGTGFSNTTDTWLPINPNYVTLNLESQKQTTDRATHYDTYKRVVQARGTYAAQHGDMSVATLPGAEDVLLMTRSVGGKPILLVAVNFGKTAVVADLTTIAMELPENLYVYAGSVQSGHTPGHQLPSTAVPLGPKAGVLLSTESDSRK